MFKQYESFEIQIAEKIEGRYAVTAQFRGGSWSDIIPSDLPLVSTAEISRAREWIERGFIDRDYARDFGDRLFRTLFPESISLGFRESLQQTDHENKGMRIVLTLPDSLTNLPWELIYDEAGGLGFVARSEMVSLARHATGIPIPHHPPEQAELRVLVIAASPKGFSPISADKEITGLTKTFKQGSYSLVERMKLFKNIASLKSLGEYLKGRSRVEVDVLEGATRLSLLQRIADAQKAGKGFHIIHFIGHGVVDSGGSWIALEGEGKKPDLILAEDFAEMIAVPGVCLVVLNACQTAAALGFFDSLAQEIMKRRVPAVIGMQVQVLDRSALDFAQYFYSFWAAGEPIEYALAMARRLLTLSSPGAAADWGIPVLFMGPVEGINLQLMESTRPRWSRRIWAFLSLLLLTIIPTVIFYKDTLQQLHPTVIPMQAGFNIAIAQIGELQIKGKPLRQSRNSEYLTDLVKKGLKPLEDEPGLKGLVSIEVQPRLIQGRTLAEREASARKLAKEVNATILIYGVMDLTQEEYIFTPEVFIGDQFADIKDLADPGDPYSTQINSQGELAGTIEFGEPLNFRLPFINDTKNAIELTEQLDPLLKALSYFSIGLAHYYNDRPDQASQNLETAADYMTAYYDQFPSMIHSSETDFKPGLGVIKLFQGASLLRKSGYEEKEEDSIADILAAEEAYLEALKVTENQYPRATLGLGNVALVQATYFPDYDLGLLDEAINFYQQVLDQTSPLDSTSSLYLRAKAYLNLGLAQVYKEEFSLEESCPKQDAVQNITLAFAEYEKSPQILLLEEIGAKSAYQLGLLYSNCANKLQSKGKKSEAAVQYSLAVEQFQKSKDLSQPHITNNPGWLGLPIFVPPPEKHDVSWHRLRWETLNQIAYVYLSQADLGDTAQCEQVISILTELKEGYSTSSNSMASSTAAQAFYNLGLAYECSGKPDLAIEAYETSLKNSNQGSELASRTRDRLKALGR